MILLANILAGLAVVLDMLLWFVLVLVMARVVISWVNADPYNPLVRFVVSSTDPMLQPLRRFIPPLGALDISPLVLVALVYFLEYALVRSLMEYSQQMKFAG